MKIVKVNDFIVFCCLSLNFVYIFLDSSRCPLCVDAPITLDDNQCWGYFATDINKKQRDQYLVDETKAVTGEKTGALSYLQGEKKHLQGNDKYKSLRPCIKVGTHVLLQYSKLDNNLIRYSRYKKTVSKITYWVNAKYVSILYRKSVKRELELFIIIQHANSLWMMNRTILKTRCE